MEAKETIEAVVKHQKALKLDDSEFVARYARHLGSVRAWERMKAGEISPKAAGRLAAFLAELAGGGGDGEEWFSELPIARYAAHVYQALAGAKTDRRVAWLIGPTGIGKSATLKRLAAANPHRGAYVRANQTWKDSAMQISRGLAAAVGAPEAAGAARTFGGVLSALRADPVTILVDEVHEGGVLLIKLLKSLVDETGSRVILGVYPTAWARLVNGSTDATAEAQQLLGRTLKPIETRWMGGVCQADVEKYLEKAAGISGARALAGAILPDLRRAGNLRLLADAVATARANAEEEDEEISAEWIEAAVRKLSPGRNRE